MKKKVFSLLLASLVGVSALWSCASDTAEEEDTEEESSAQTLTVSDPDYYTRFKGQNLSINVYNWGEYISDGSEDTLMPVSALRSIIISVKDWPAGTTVGYGRHGVLQRDSRIATVNIGYADGFDRHFGNGRASMWVNGVLCPTVGNVCMDAVMIDVTDVPTVKTGDTVEIFGEHLPVEQLSEARGTIPYEILTSVSPRVKRVYYRE